VALLHRSENKKPLRPRAGAPTSAAVSALRPQQVAKASPCQNACLAGTDVRAALALLNQHEKLGLTQDEACERAWRLIVETNPFPATTGRICPHRCEDSCNRHGKDGGVAVGMIERFLGDWALERELPLPGVPERPLHRERIAIIGAGPAGLSCAYHLARRGYVSTIFEGMPQPGGMLRYGIPAYRLPTRVLEGEIRRVLDVGVELRTRTTIGRDVTLDQLRQQYAAVFVAPGAASSREVDIPGANGLGVFRAVEFLRDVARGEPPAIGKYVVVAGGGNSALDAARVCARLLGGTGVITLLRQENESIDDDLREAMAEGVEIEFMTTLNSVVRNVMGGVDSALVQRVELGEKDASGFSTLLPVAGKSYELRADTIILALGQKPNVNRIFKGNEQQFETDDQGKTRAQGVWRGGDAVTPSFAAVVIGQGRQVALSIDSELRGQPLPEASKPAEVPGSRLKLECYDPRPRLQRRLAPVQDRLSSPQSELELDQDVSAVLSEASRCLSCGNCFGCERCWMYCTPGCVSRLPDAQPGRYFAINTDKCDGCRKCAEECPAGFLEMS
jgi:NADPH-dependent glutamate synthase beta subunit-like oxidoreductase/Pyruvate/2-oxoacid:ferredoxin oxidoreductase delta subunit